MSIHPSRRRVLQLMLSALPLSGLEMAWRQGRSGPPGSRARGPGGDAIAAPDVQTVRVLMPAPFVDATASAVQRFNRHHDTVQIAVTRGPLDTEALSDLASSSLLLGSSPFDLLLMDVSWTARYAAAGWLEPLEPLLGDDAMAGLLPEARLGNAFGGHLWRIPLTADTGLLYWRSDLLPRAPRDTAELVAMARELQGQGKVRWGYLWQGRQYEGLSCVVLEVLHAFGARWWDGRAGRTDLLGPGALEAINWLADLVRSGLTPPGVANFAENDALQLFNAGDAAFLRNWPYAWALMQEQGTAVRGRVGVVPMIGAPGFPGGGALGTWGFCLLAGSPHPQAAAQAIRWLTGPEVQRELVLSQGYAPTWPSLYEDADLRAAHPLLAVQRQALSTALVRPLTPLYAQLSDVLQRQINAVLAADLRPEVALARAQRQSDLVIRASGAPLSR